jgi:hypothetical protein
MQTPITSPNWNKQQELTGAQLDKIKMLKAKQAPLKNVTWALGDKPTKTLKMSTGCYAETVKK